MKKQLQILCFLFTATLAVRAQNVPLSTSATPSAVYLKALPPAYSGTPANYLRSFAPVIPITDTSLINMSSDVEDVQTTVNYADSYGRTVETVSKQMSPAKKDLVSAPYYDLFGRSDTRSYMPFAAVSGNTDDGYFKTNPFQQDSAFYKAQFPDENVICSQTEYDNSPFNIPVKSMSPGNEWGGAGRGKTFAHRASTNADSVKYWQIDITGENDLPYTSSYYVAGSLTVKEITDEHGIKAVSYSDRLGRTVLTKSQLSASPAAGQTGWLCTYYVFDDMGHVRVIIPPKAVVALKDSSWSFGADSSIYKGLCYAYYYDARGRVTMKYIPGKGKNYVAYDAGDRPVMTQDPNLRGSSQWAFVLYDNSLRPFKTGVITPGISKDSVLAQAARSMDYPTLSGTYTVMTQSFYENYSWLSSEGDPLSSAINTARINSTNFITSYNSSPDYAQYVSQSNRLRGMPTGSKTLVLGTTDYLYNVIFYDENGRVSQTQQTNYTGGTDISTVQYAFNGRVLRKLTAHQKSGTNAQVHTVLTKLSYDHTGRLLTITKNSDSSYDRIISTLSYKETGQLDSKVLGPGLETQEFKYNIRGSLTAINKDYIGSTSSAYFGEELFYAHGFTDSLYNGQVSGVKWRTGGDNVLRAYGYRYDNAGRLISADFVQDPTVSNTWSSAETDYTVSGISYDAGGNMLSMKQRGLLINSSATIDSMAYSYFGNSNLLKKVSDGATAGGTLGDFKDSTNTNDDYAYDANGNIVKDYNRHMYISSGNGAVFNLLDKPDSMVIAGKSCTYYTYDAGGVMLKRRVKDYANNTDRTYLYINGFIYLNDTLQYALTEEGRMRKGLYGIVVYDYFVKDHASNVRAVLTDEQRTDYYPVATMETGSSTTEEAVYANIPETRTSRPHGFDPDPDDNSTFPPTTPTDNYVSVVKSGSGMNNIGPSIILKVMAGDTFNVEVNSWYTLNSALPDPPVSPLTDIITSMVSGVSGSVMLNTHGVTSGGLSGSGAFSNVSDLLTDQTGHADPARPKAFLNWVLFDEQFKYVSAGSGFEQVGDDGVTTAMVHTDMPIGANGYLYVYVSNETPNIDVYFDDLQVTHHRGPLLETNEYYPYGMAMKNISYRAAGATVNRYKSNGGSEHEDEGELNYVSTFYRKYDAQIGRFTGIDMYAEKFSYINPYQFGNNNPVMFSDPTGAVKEGPKDKTATMQELLNYIANNQIEILESGSFVRDSEGGGDAVGFESIDEHESINTVSDIGPSSSDRIFQTNSAVRKIDIQKKTITIIANYYVITQGDYAYTQKDINTMNTYSTQLNALGGHVSEGVFAGYVILFQLTFYNGGDMSDASHKSYNDYLGDHRIGNTVCKDDEETNRNLKPQEDKFGNEMRYGGYNDNGNIIMNKNYDTKMFRIHEMFHGFGFSHPEGGAFRGIMKYNTPSWPNQSDFNYLGDSNNTYLPVIYTP